MYGARWLPQTTLVILTTACTIGWTGCNKDSPVDPVSSDTNSNENPFTHPDDLGGGLRSIGAWTSIAWPFGPYENPSQWTGWQGERTGGGTINACGGPINSHSGADYYSRDLYRNDGQTMYRPVYAGLAGRVVVAGSDGGYGLSVVIHYPRQRLLIRYAHLSGIAYISVGQNVAIRQLIGYVGNTPGGNFSPHLHLTVYENVDTNPDGSPRYIPNLCRGGTWHACRVYFFC